MARAVHRLQREDAIVVGVVAGNRHLEHVVAVPAPVARRLPQALVEHLRRVDLLIALLVEAAAHVADQALEHLPALGMPEHDARPLLLEMEEVHFAAEPAMVALLGFLQHMEIGIELRLIGPGRAVDARQHRVVAVAAPIGSGHLHQLEGIADLAGRSHVRTAAEVEPVALRVDLQILIFGNGVDQFDLVALTLVVEDTSCARAVPHLLGEGPVATDDLAHLLLDGRKIVRRERLVAGEIVVEAVLDHRPDRHLRSRPQFLHRFGEHVRRIVANQLERARVVAGDDLDLAGRAERVGKVAHGAVERVGDGLLGQRFRNLLRERGAGRRRIVLADGTIGKLSGKHWTFGAPIQSRKRARVVIAGCVRRRTVF